MTDDEYLRAALSYEPNTGILRWKRSTGGKLQGTPAGTLDHGYVRVVCRRKRLYAHRVAWFLARGEWPREMVDHINGDGSDNRLCNLRGASRSQNNANRVCVPPKGFSRHVSGLYHARIKKDRRTHSLGYFRSPEAAHCAYREAALRLFGEFSWVADP